MNEQTKILEIAERIRGLRDILEVSVEDMAIVTNVTPAEYIQYENGEKDFSFTFLYKCAKKFGVDISELISGDSPKLSQYEIVRVGEGLPIERRQGFSYKHLAYMFKNKSAEPFVVTAKYEGDVDINSIQLSTHKGQEMDYVLSGSLKIKIDNHIETLNAGDCIYYDSSIPHGMVATNLGECVFLAIVIK